MTIEQRIRASHVLDVCAGRLTGLLSCAPSGMPLAEPSLRIHENTWPFPSSLPAPGTTGGLTP